MRSISPSRYLAVLLLLVLLAQMIFASPLQSASFDETYRITFGYAYLRTGDDRLSRGQNPPLADVLIALPLLLRSDIVFPIDQPAWQSGDVYGFADEFLWKANADPQSIVMLARLAEMMLALLLACAIYAFARSLFGDSAALAALFLCVFDPNLLAHGHIVGTDLGVTLFIFASIGLLVSALKRSSGRRIVIAGLLAGAALSSKYTAVWLGPIALLALFSYPNASLKFSMRIRYLVLFGLAAFVVIWATFKFSFGPIVEGSPSFPAPQYWSSLTQVGNRVEASTPAFMLNQISPDGFLGYYPYVFLIKTPLITLFGLLLSAIGLITRRDRKLIAVWSAPLLFFAAAIIGHLDLGYRLILPVLPFVLVLAGYGLASMWSTSKENASVLRGAANALGPLCSRRMHLAKYQALPESASFDFDADSQNPHRRSGCFRCPARIASIGLAAILIVELIVLGPSHIAYFNSFLIDRDHDYNYLVDSNLDWGQDLIALRDWQVTNHVDQINLAYYGTARPAAYGVHANLLPSFSLNDFGTEVDGFNANALAPGWYAISATSLQLGLLYTHWNEYAAFRSIAPIARVGRSLLIYHIEYASSAIDRSVVLGPSAGDLDRETLGGPLRADRQLLLKWAGDDAAVLDMQGPARYITRGGDPIVGFAPDVHDLLIANAQRLGSDSSGDLRLFQIDASSALKNKLTALVALPVRSIDGARSSLPISFPIGLSFIGYDLSKTTVNSGDTIDLITYWRVTGSISPSLSVFTHLADSSGKLIGQSDGLNVKLSTLQTNDVIMQHHLIRIDSAVPLGPYVLSVGLYSPIDQQTFGYAVRLSDIVVTQP